MILGLEFAFSGFQIAGQMTELRGLWSVVQNSVKDLQFPQGSVLGPVLFTWGERIECTLSKFSSDTNLGGVANTSEGWAATKEELDRLENQAKGNVMKFSKGTCRVLHLRRNDPMHHYILEVALLESSSAEKGLWILVDCKLIMSQQQTRPVVPWSALRMWTASRSREILLSGEATSAVL